LEITTHLSFTSLQAGEALSVLLLIRYVQEAKNGIISLDDDDPLAVKHMLRYLYTLKYDDSEGAPTVPDPAATGTATITATDSEDSESKLNINADTHEYMLMSNVQVYALAEKYDVPALKQLAMAKFGALTDFDQSVSKIPDVIEAVFTSTPETDMGLRDIVIGICHVQITSVLQDNCMVDMIKKHGDLGLGMLRASLEYHQDDLLNFAAAKLGLRSQIAALEFNLQAFLDGTISIVSLKAFQASIEPDD